MAAVNKLLISLFYDVHTGYHNVNKLYQDAHAIEPKITYADVLEFYNEQEINQLSKKPHVTHEQFYKIVAPDLSFMVDHIFINKSLKGSHDPKADSDYYIFLLCVDIGSRKAYIYHQKNKTVQETIYAFDKFIVDLNKDIHTLFFIAYTDYTIIPTLTEFIKFVHITRKHN